jgi:hypothetical protein
MTRRLVAATVLAGSVALMAAPAFAYHHDARACIGGDDRNTPGRMVGFCLEDPRTSIPLPPPPPPPL